MHSIRELDIARNWEPLHEALQQHVRIPLLRDHSKDWSNTKPRRLGRSFANSGQILATDSKDVVLWYTLVYSCMHFDALIDLMNTDEFRVDSGLYTSSHMSVLHVDFGCGPGTSAWAIMKNLPATAQLETIGHDHNPHMTDLATAIVQTISKSASLAITFDFLSEWSRFHLRVMRSARRKDLLLVTVNSLFGQTGFNSPDLSNLIDMIMKLRNDFPTVPLLVFGTHPLYRTNTVSSYWDRIAGDFSVTPTYNREQIITSWIPTLHHEDIQDSWWRWKPGSQLARILVLPPAGGNR